jgi:hypothetical protein
MNHLWVGRHSALFMVLVVEWIALPVDALECIWVWVWREAELEMQPLTLTMITGLTPNLLREGTRSADFDGVTPWRYGGGGLWQKNSPICHASNREDSQRENTNVLSATLDESSVMNYDEPDEPAYDEPADDE